MGNCKDCKWWGRNCSPGYVRYTAQYWWGYKPDEAECDLMDDETMRLAYAEVVEGGYSPIVTKENFGCVQFEVKE